MRLFSTNKVILENDAMAFDNLAIVKIWDTLRYATIQGENYGPSIRQFHLRDCVWTLVYIVSCVYSTALSCCLYGMCVLYCVISLFV